VTDKTARRLRLVRLSAAVGAMAVLLGIEDFLIALTSQRFQPATRIGLQIVAAVLGVIAIRDLVGLVVRRFQGPQAVVWRNLSTWTLYALLALWLLSQGVNLSGLLVGGAIFGVVVASASQSSLGNFFAGLVLMVSQPYRVGAAIRLRSALVGGAEYEGTVIDQGALYTTLRGSGGEIVRLPNSAVVTSALVLGAPPLQAGVDLELPAQTQVSLLVDGLKARLGNGAVVSLEPQGFKAGEDDLLLCRLEVRSTDGVPPQEIAQALVEALHVASRTHVAA
jgi:hypothetical protein